MSDHQKRFMETKLKIAISRRAFAIASENPWEIAGYNEIISRTITGLATNIFM